MDRGEAHRILRTHLPVPVRRWLGWRLRCLKCERWHPCETYRAALDELAKPWWGRRA